jgi:hypothetical protein
MCIIAVKPKGVGMPTKKHLKNCWDNNSDGAGWMWHDPKEGEVVVDKGYMTWDAFWKAVCRANFTKKDTVVFHFRYATAGLTCAGNTHPFPLSHDEDDLQALTFRCPIAMVHNGIFGKGEGHLSDTMVIVRDMFSDPVVRDNMGSLVMQTLIEEYVHGSKLAFLDGKGSITMFGGAWENAKGVRFSNGDYKRVWVGYGFGKKDAQWGQNPNWKKGGGSAPCNTCAESTCEDCDYWEYLKGVNDDNKEAYDADYEYAPSCPLCREFDDLVSDYQGIYECMSCGAVYDKDRRIIATTVPSNQSYTTQYTGNEIPCNDCDKRTNQECVDCERWHDATSGKHLQELPNSREQEE